MPELPEVEVLVRRLRPLMKDKRVNEVLVRRPKVLGKSTVACFRKTLRGARFVTVNRRGKYLLFALEKPPAQRAITLVGHLGMTGRMYLQTAEKPLPKHAAVVLDLGRERFVFEDTRYFGKLTLGKTSVEALGPEPLSAEFTLDAFAQALRRSKQAIKVKLLDQRLVAGVGNIYASEALFRAGVSPKAQARRLKREQIERLRLAIREVLTEAIGFGSTVPLNVTASGKRPGLFYFGRAPGAPDFYEERLQVYDRAGQPCPRCGQSIKRIVQAGRSTFYCPACQR